LNRRHLIIALLAGANLAACGRRGPLEPPPYTAQGQEWQRRQGRNPDGTPRRTASQQQAQGTVQEGLQREQDARRTVDVEGDIERNRTEGTAREPNDPTQSEPGGTTPVAPGVSPQGMRRRPPGIVPPKRDFILDPLL
jgi:predicted small lipoprotein YifL